MIYHNINDGVDDRDEYMHISCPYCTSIFDVKRSALDDSGKQVQCGICKHEWFVDPAIYADIPETDISVDVFLDDGSAPSISYGAHDTIAIDRLPADNMPSLLQSAYGSGYQSRRFRQSLIFTAWLILIVVTFSMVTYAVFYRDILVEKFPALSKIYNAVNLDVDEKTNVMGFVISDINFSVQFRNLERILNIESTITNISGETATVPTLRLSLVNIYGVEEYVTRIKMSPQPIAPDATITFEHTIFDFTQNAADILILFLKRSEDLYSNVSLANPDEIPYKDVVTIDKSGTEADTESGSDF
ncbi:MAG: zinc-ribbon domain-containing protein [Alphaproteobacteria bacterium]|nr:zinc-ribbon domain-containing protein [Alphaproteobacteria bacterium]